MVVELNGRVPRLPLAFFGLGVLSLLTLAVVFLVGLPSIAGAWFRNPWALVSTHLFTLGFATPVIFGAFYQLIPVMSEAKLWSERLGWGHLVFHVLGFLCLLHGFAHVQPALLIAGGSMLLTGGVLFVIGMVATIRVAPRWHPALTFICVALFNLLVVFSLGLTLALNWSLGFLGAATRAHLIQHAIWGFGGWLTLTILGVALKLVPLFTLTHKEPGTLGVPVLVLFNVGIYVGLWWRVPGLLLMTLAILVYLGDMAMALRSRIRRVWDISLRYAGHGLLWLGIGGVLSLVGALYGLTAGQAVGTIYALAIGWVGLLIVGHLFKILPFLVWTARYAPLAGREKVPLLTDLYNSHVANCIRYLLSLGCLGVVVGLWTNRLPIATVGAGLVAIAAVLICWSFYRIVRRDAHGHR
ncbi:MAG TPA: hypothetical protein VK191_16995 [Symbiobacteriaceae bacterium]|nr:hypothetical protein [Symbiobacteriaceae bacterium]